MAHAPAQQPHEDDWGFDPLERRRVRRTVAADAAESGGDEALAPALPAAASPEREPYEPAAAARGMGAWSAVAVGLAGLVQLAWIAALAILLWRLLT